MNVWTFLDRNANGLWLLAVMIRVEFDGGAP